MIELYKQAPSFELLDQNLKLRNLGEFKGKWLILFFYPKDDTPGWTIEVRTFGESLNKFKELNTVVFGISSDSIDSHINFLNKYGFKVDLLSDPTKSISKKYFSVGKRNTFMIDPNNNVQKIYIKPKPSEHVDEVLADLSKKQKVNFRS